MNPFMCVRSVGLPCFEGGHSILKNVAQGQQIKDVQCFKGNILMRYLRYVTTAEHSSLRRRSKSIGDQELLDRSNDLESEIDNNIVFIPAAPLHA